VVAWIVAQARRLGRFILQAGVPADPNARLRLAIRDAGVLARGLGNRITRPTLEGAIGVLRTRYGLTGLTVSERNRQWSVTATINPTVTAVVATTPPGTPGATPATNLPTRTPLIAIQPAFVMGRNLRTEQVEYDRQLNLQAAGINAMSVKNWIQNRLAFIARRTAPGSTTGRAPASAAQQQALRANVRSDLVRRLGMPQSASGSFTSLGSYELQWVSSVFNVPAHAAFRATGFTVIGPAAAGHPTAGSLVDAWMRTQHALHSPDQIAGGDITTATHGLTGLGSGSINSSIGAQWSGARINYIMTTLNAHLASGWAGGPPITTDADKDRVQMYVSLAPAV
jgi:Novel toxin 15